MRCWNTFNLKIRIAYAWSAQRQKTINQIIALCKRGENTSLTSFINIPEVSDKFTDTFHYPKLEGTPELLCPPQTNHYSMIGTAFDYLLRFAVEVENEQAITKKWVAETAVEMTKNTGYFKVCNAALKEATNAYNNYKKTKKLADETLRGALLLAQLDPIYRAGTMDPNIGTIEKLDIEDMKNLISCAKLDAFKAKKVCHLNPTFGAGSILVGGADADIIIDNTIIDIKTVKNFKLDKKYYNQLIGYYILGKIGGIDGLNEKLEIKNLAIYYSRHATFVNFKISEIMKDVDEVKFTAWFKKTARDRRHSKAVDLGFA